ncbi:hypothetical protein BDB01DRAFT_833227 [Pilobolus umbonatus]|nr:hypothetical protein BDB01DRAFT_833227 [Pilobolus umbonatus]
MPNTNQTLFILIFCLLAVVLILLTYVLWLRRMKRRAKEELLAEEHRMESANHPFNSSISPEKLQQLKPVLLQKLYGKDIDRRRNDQSNPLNNNKIIILVLVFRRFDEYEMKTIGINSSGLNIHQKGRDLPLLPITYQGQSPISDSIWINSDVFNIHYSSSTLVLPFMNQKTIPSIQVYRGVYFPVDRAYPPYPTHLIHDTA